MNEIKFKTLQELYNRILPALKSKVQELKYHGFKYIKENDIWDYLKDYKWATSSNLDLSAMVNDIFNVTEDELYKYLKENIGDQNE